MGRIDVPTSLLEIALVLEAAAAAFIPWPLRVIPTVVFFLTASCLAYLLMWRRSHARR